MATGLGGEGFLRKLKDQWNRRVERPKNSGQKKSWLAVGAEQILERVSEHFQFDLERLKQRRIRNNLARRCAITLCWDHAGLSHNEIAALFEDAQQQFGVPNDSAKQGPKRPNSESPKESGHK